MEDRLRKPEFDDISQISDAELDEAKELSSSSEILQEKVKNYLVCNTDKLKKKYSDSRLEEKIKAVGKKVGATVLYPVILLFTILKSSSVTSKDKMLIIAPLAYFILPSDLIPDIFFGLGFIDDGIAVMASVQKLSSYVTPEISQQSRDMCHNLIGDIDEDILNEVVNFTKENEDGIAKFVNDAAKKRKGKMSINKFIKKFF